ncbi:MAG: HD domain-containing protein, partial [Myxococcales bacterium]|nr:HD domain-containing protein [Myxococcales bacterium]
MFPKSRVKRALSGSLVELGYDVISHDAPQFRPNLPTGFVDVVIFDATGCHYDATSAAKRLAQSDALKGLPLLALVAPHSTAIRQQLLEAGVTDFLCLPFEPVELKTRVRNVIVLGRQTAHWAEQIEMVLSRLRSQAQSIHDGLERLEQSSEAIRSSQELAIGRLAHAAELRDDVSGEHTRRVAEYSSLLAQRLGFDEPYCELVRTASPLHDMGKVAIPDSILLKPEGLTPSEFEVIKEHPRLGFELLSGTGSEVLDFAATIALTHHERYDGTGYPLGLGGHEIPIVGRITAVADVFDALTSTRCYKPAFSVSKSLEMMRIGRGTHFDPDVLDC